MKRLLSLKNREITAQKDKIMKNYVKILGIFCICLAAADSLWAEHRAIVPVERHSETFYVNVSVNHENRVYEEGDMMKVSVTSSRDGYLYLLYKDASGNSALLFPNKFHQSNKINANQETLVPSVLMNFDLKTMAPFGKELLQAIVTSAPIEHSSVTNFRGCDSVKILTETDLKNFSETLSRAMGVVARDEDENSEMAEFTMQITTKAKGQPLAEQSGKRIFVGICASRYTDRMIPPLPACRGDMTAIGKFFAESPAIDADKSLVYIDEDVTKEKIHDLFFDYLPKETNPGDEIIIYWTGHGGRCSDTNGDEADGFDETLVLYDSKRTDPKTQLRDDEFGRWVQNLSGRKILFILDTCHSSGLGNLAKGLTDKPDDANLKWDFGFSECSLIKDIGQSNLALIASCAQSELSLVRPDHDMSVMTWYIMEELKKIKDLSHTQLYKNIKDKVRDYVKDEYDVEQNVFIQDDFESPMILNP